MRVSSRLAASWVLASWLFGAVLGTFAGSARVAAQDVSTDVAHSSFRVDVVGGQRGETVDDTTEWTLDLPSPAPLFVDVDLELVLASRLDECLGDPLLCLPPGGDGGEICDDRRDNDGDGLADLDDPGCRLIEGWTAVVLTPESVQIRGLAFSGTVSDLDHRPPGRRSTVAGNFFSAGQIVPQLNGGANGFHVNVLLSFGYGIYLDPVSDNVVLRATARLPTLTGEPPGEPAGPFEIRIVPPAAQPTRYEIQILEPDGSVGHVADRDVWTSADWSTPAAPAPAPAVTHTRIRLVFPPVPFLRGDPNADGTEDLADGIVILDYLFLAGEAPSCFDAADTDDSGGVELTDAIGIFNHLFLGGPAPRSPGPLVCGEDPTEDALGCDIFAACP